MSADQTGADHEEEQMRAVLMDQTGSPAVPMCSITAWQALFTHGQLQPGQRVLVHGAAGGVGHLAIQLAKHGGAVEVIGTGSAASHDFVIGLGADRMVDYTQVPLGSAGT